MTRIHEGHGPPPDVPGGPQALPGDLRPGFPGVGGRGDFGELKEQIDLRRLPSFTTERLAVRPMRKSDAHAIFEIKKDEQVTTRYAHEPYRSPEEARKWIRDRLSAQGAKDSAFWVIVPKGEALAVGAVCFWHFDHISRRAEIGYELGRPSWGKGYMSEALPPIISFGFERLRLSRIEACPFAGNEASRGVLVKLGFKYEGTLRQHDIFRERRLDLTYYGLLREEWEGGPSTPGGRAPTYAPM